jgi:hypothetical protein
VRKAGTEDVTFPNIPSPPNPPNPPLKVERQ